MMNEAKRKFHKTVEEVEAKLHEKFGFSVDRQKEFEKLYALCIEDNNHTARATSFDPKVRAMIEQLQGWHQERIDTLTEVGEEDDDTPIYVADSEGNQVEVTGKMAKGLKAGLSIAVELFTPFPITMQHITETQEEE